MATVKEILSIPALRKLKVIGGQQGLNKRVSYVTVMEVPDIEKRLKGNDFIITSLYAIKDNIKVQIDLIDRLADTHCSCLAIKTGQYIKEVDSRIIERANIRGLVLVEIPQEVTYIEIIVNAMDKILQNRDIDYMIERYMKDILFDNYDDKEIIYQRGKLLGFNIEDNYNLAITLSPDYEATTDEIKQLRKTSKNIAKASDLLLKYTYNPVVTVGQNSSILIFTSQEKYIKGNLERIIELIEAQMIESDLKNIYVGVGSIGEGLDNLKSSYFRSLDLIKMKNLIKKDKNILIYDELKIYIALDKFLRDKGYDIFDSIYNELDSDLLLTLEAFYENNMDINKTGEQLFIHKNTVRYRLRKIKEITGYDTSIFEHNFNLYLLLIYSSLKKQP